MNSRKRKAFLCLLSFLFFPGCRKSSLSSEPDSSSVSSSLTQESSSSFSSLSSSSLSSSSDDSAFLEQMAEDTYRLHLSRHFTVEPYTMSPSLFPTMAITECTFLSNLGQKLTGYQCSKKDTTPVGVVILAHGLGDGGATNYFDVADYFTSNGFLVFAFDATGNDKSEGDSCIGIEQGFIDLSYAIDYVRADATMGKYPLVLWGHSWGAYSVSAVLNIRPDVKAVCEVAGADSALNFYELMVDQPNLSDTQRKTVVEDLKEIGLKAIGAPYSGYTSLTGFAHSSAPVMLIHSKADQKVPVEMGYDLFKAAYSEDSRFTFRLYENRTHFDLYYTDAARAYRESYDPRNGFGNYDKSIACELDQDLMGEIRDFFRKACTGS